MPKVKVEKKKPVAKKVVVKEKVYVKTTIKKRSTDNSLLTTIIAIILVVFILGLIAFVADQRNSNLLPNEKRIESVKTITYKGEDGKTALELLQKRADIEIQESSIGTFVTAIDGTANSDNQFWVFYVNGELAPYSADQYKTKNGEQIEWRYDLFE